MHTSKLSVWLALPVLFAFQLSVPQPQGSMGVKLGRVVQGFSVDESNFALAVIAVATKFDVPMGIEWIEPPAPTPVKISWKRATVRQMLESIVRAHSGYELEISDGMAHVFYNGALKGKMNFLNIRIPQFEVRNEYVAGALFDLHLRANQIVFPRPPPRSLFRGFMLDPHDKRVNLQFRDATVRQILNRLTLLSGYKVWCVTFRPALGLTPAEFRRTVSLWNNTPFTDYGQPHWDRFAWGKPLPGQPLLSNPSKTQNLSGRR